MGVMRRMVDHLRVDQAAENQQAQRKACGTHMMDRSGHRYGREALREAVCVSRSTT
jgi:hypothetical protein